MLTSLTPRDSNSTHLLECDVRVSGLDSETFSEPLGGPVTRVPAVVSEHVGQETE